MNKQVITVTLNPAVDKTIYLKELNVGSLNRVEKTETYAGGKGINVAKLLRAFDVDVIATGFMAGNQGKNLLELLDQEGLEHDFVFTNGETRTNLKLMDGSTGLTTEINEKGFSVNVGDVDKLKQKMTFLLEKAELLILSGSLPVGINPEIYKELIELSKNKGVKTILDADGEAFNFGIKALPFAIKPNIHELERFMGRGLNDLFSIKESAEQLVKKGIKSVIVSMGENGAIFASGEDVVKSTPFDIELVCSVAAGDSMVAAFAYALVNGFNRNKTVQFATAAGTLTAAKPGSSVCDPSEVFKRYNEISLEKL